jgi:hypothetical protein
MSEIPPRETGMGRLKLHEIYVRYDGPRLFSCVNESGAFFFGLFVEANESGEVYIYAPASPARLNAVRSGHMPLRQAFANPLDGGVFVVTSTSDLSRSVEWRAADQIPDEWLPSADARLHLDTPTLAPLDVADIEREARAIGRTIAVFELDAPWMTTEFPLRPLGEVMRTVQDSIDSFAQIATNKQTNRGAVQRELLEETELTFYGLRAASFAFLVSSSPGGRLFESDLISRSLSELAILMDAAESDTLQEALGKLHPRALSKYRDLLEQLDDVESGLTTIIAPPTAPATKSLLTRDGVRVSLELVRNSLGAEIEEIAIEGVLIGVNARTWSFELLDDSSDRRYSGKTAESARSRLVGLTIGYRYRARLWRETELLPVTGEVHHKYRLFEIEPVSRPATAIELED